MKHNEMATANTLGTLGGIYYIFCYAVASLFPGLYKTVAVSWFHMLRLEGLWKSVPSGFAIGLISFTATSWISGWLFARLFNYFSGKK
ncbi:hypothetical protein A3A75_05230 [Candidatus Woesebacteria bacterium RIFCSPLOWO2_01_FULL_39_10]|uniref:DUF2062 domain-containing protein n=1 Tax=Candidatus Woesebacteria bacterium RIFCSPLOWO2_01_FULL_39_10 TaxID=1802516 RepID=A0A1F8B4U3_9BACT|nr:MAG: hypothetical protein A3A75_05230 [Candidatus Woesebacteria bacterium RIFCSPLOWO2_01_FULL_39_10]